MKKSIWIQANVSVYIKVCMLDKRPDCLQERWMRWSESLKFLLQTFRCSSICFLSSKSILLLCAVQGAPLMKKYVLWMQMLIYSGCCLPTQRVVVAWLSETWFLEGVFEFWLWLVGVGVTFDEHLEVSNKSRTKEAECRSLQHEHIPSSHHTHRNYIFWLSDTSHSGVSNQGQCRFSIMSCLFASHLVAFLHYKTLPF